MEDSHPDHVSPEMPARITTSPLAGQSSCARRAAARAAPSVSTGT